MGLRLPKCHRMILQRQAKCSRDASECRLRLFYSPVRLLLPLDRSWISALSDVLALSGPTDAHMRSLLLSAGLLSSCHALLLQPSAMHARASTPTMSAVINESIDKENPKVASRTRSEPFAAPPRPPLCVPPPRASSAPPSPLPCVSSPPPPAAAAPSPAVAPCLAPPHLCPAMTCLLWVHAI